MWPFIWCPLCTVKHHGITDIKSPWNNTQETAALEQSLFLVDTGSWEGETPFQSTDFTAQDAWLPTQAIPLKVQGRLCSKPVL